MRDFGILKLLSNAPEGLTTEDIRSSVDLSEYSLSVLMDGAESMGLVEIKNGRYVGTDASEYLEKDALTRANMDFTQDVCYLGMFQLKESLLKGKPEGLKVFGSWPTIYEGLTQLPPQALKSWLAFDHYYSDDTFPRVMPYVFKDGPKKILDVGGNTGKFARACARHNEDVHVTILDYPQQLSLAEQESRQAGLQDRIHFQPQRLLDHSQPFPKDFDLIWMSQFLDCFGKEDVLALMKRARDAMSDDSSLLIMEPFIDKQNHETSRFCLNMGSLYFTAMANGNSRFYRAEDFYKLLAEAGLRVDDEIRLRLSHCVLKCKKV
jgi:ubiquinone/menaquinone biosynthesis C-methylase UbiE